MDALDRITNIPSATREYYGEDPENKPNDHCHWSDSEYFPGWYETDEHLRERMKKRLEK